MADEDLNAGAEAPEVPLEAQIKATALDQMSKSEDITAYAAEPPTRSLRPMVSSRSRLLKRGSTGIKQPSRRRDRQQTGPAAKTD
jgi:hypothetical protein